MQQQQKSRFILLTHQFTDKKERKKHMGFMDNFTTDGMVEMKHTEYYNLMREAAKAELIEKAVKADVPGFYIQAMITGEKPEFQNTLEAEEESTGFGAEYEQMTGAAVSIFEAWTKENGVESAAASMHRIIDTLAQNRMDELKTMEANQKENEERMKEAVKEAVETMGHMPVISMGIDFGKGKTGHRGSGLPGPLELPDVWKL
jgi:hypothetical protein